MLDNAYTKEDLLQEAALLRLLGVANPSLRVIARKHSQPVPAYDVLPEGTSPWGQSAVSDPVVTLRLIDWAFEQSPEIEGLIFGFLEEPTNQGLTELLFDLECRGVPIYQISFTPELSVTDLILRSLPATKDELYELVQREHTTRRPAATVRQILRRLQKSGIICLQGDYYAEL